MVSRHFEADVLYPRRYLVDKGVTAYFDIVKEQDQWVAVRADEPKTPPPIKVWYFDSEMDSSDRMPDPKVNPVTCWCLTDGKQVISAILNDVSLQTQDGYWGIAHFEQEKHLLQFLLDTLWLVQPDVIAGWNIPFDLDYIKERMKASGISLDLDGICDLDLLPAYRKLYRRGSYRLKDIAVAEGLAPSAATTPDYGRLWREDKAGLLALNKQHALWLAQIDQKRRITAYLWGLKELCGLENLEGTIYNSALIDSMLLRESKDVLPSKEEHEHEDYEGAFVMQPPPGVFKGVAILDLSRFFPSIILSEKLDPIILHHYLKWKESGLSMGEYIEPL